MGLVAAARLTTTIPNDWDPDLDDHGGRNVGLAIGETIAKLGYTTSGPFFEGIKGSDFVIEIRKRNWWYRCQHWPDWCFVQFIDDTGPISRFFTKNAEPFEDFMRRLAIDLGADARFTKIEWFENPGDAIEPDIAGGTAPIVTKG